MATKKAHTPEFGANPCGCTIGKFGHTLNIDFCGVHRAAPDLLEVLETIFDTIGPAGELPPGTWSHVHEVIAKARGK